MGKESKGKPRRKKKQNDFLFLTKHINFAWKFVILAAVIGAAQSIVASFLPNATANLFEGELVPSKLIAVFGTMLGSLVLAVGSYLFRNFAESKSVLAVRNAVWEHMLRAKSEYYDTHDPNTLLSIVTLDAQTMGAGMVQLFVFIPTMAVLALANIAQLFGQNPKLLLVLVVLIPMHLVYLLFMGRWQEKVGKEFSFANGTLTGYLAERIRNLMMVKTFNAEERELINGEKAAKRLYKVNIRYNGYIGTVITIYQALSAVLSVVLPVIWGCYLIRRGEIGVAQFIAFYTYVASINGMFLALSIVWAFVKDFSGRAYRIARLVESDKETAFSGEEHRKAKKGKNNAAQLTEAVTDIPTGDIEVRELAFRYREDEPDAISTMSFTIPQGRITAIVGPSGSGKTTLVKLLERLYTPTSGGIYAGGANVQDFDLVAWRRKLAYVVQDAGVFSGTVRDAITYGVSGEVSEEAVTKASKDAGIYDFLASLPEGFDTELASWGGSLSGGQRQRIVIARAILQDADTYIFDEPTSALDPDSAEAIRDLIFNRFRDKTVIVITHELNFIAAADQIVVIKNGVLEGVGSHSGLMEACPTYSDLVEQQSYKEVFGA